MTTVLRAGVWTCGTLNGQTSPCGGTPLTDYERGQPRRGAIRLSVDQCIVALLKQGEVERARSGRHWPDGGVEDELSQVVVVERQAVAAAVEGGVAAALDEQRLVPQCAADEQPDLATQRAETSGELVELGVPGVARVVLTLDVDVHCGQPVADQPVEEAAAGDVGVADVDALASDVDTVLELGIGERGIEQGGQQRFDGTVVGACVFRTGGATASLLEVVERRDVGGEASSLLPVARKRVRDAAELKQADVTAPWTGSESKLIRIERGV